MDIIVRVTHPNDAFRAVIHEGVSNFRVDEKGCLSIHRDSREASAVYAPGGWLSAYEQPTANLYKMNDEELEKAVQAARMVV